MLYVRDYMNLNINFIFILLIFTLASFNIFISACMAEEIRLSSVSGLNGVIEILCDNYIQKNRGVKIVRDYAAAGNIANQLESGEKIDIVIILSSRTTDILIGKDLLDRRSINRFATNRLVVVAQNDHKLTSIQDLANLERIAVGDPAIVASGEYAYQAINRAGLEKELKNRIIKTRDNRESLYLVRSGKTDGAIINKSDLKYSGLDIKSIEIPNTLYPRITYIVALTSHGKNEKNVVTFHRYLQSDEVRKILSKYDLAI